jgi:TonB-linked SusC/RagA family outer membrane protein
MARHYLINSHLKWCCLWMALLCSSHVTSAQEVLYANAKKPSASSLEQRSLRDALKEIQEHFKVSFVYESALVEGKAISGNIAYSSSVEKTLNVVLRPIGLKFRKVNRSTYSILSASNTALSASSTANASHFDSKDSNVAVIGINEVASDQSVGAQEIQVNGRVTDEQSNPIPGANILIKGTTLGTSTDSDGRFSINVPDASAILVVSFIGYVSREIVVGAQTEINVTLDADVKQLSEVVVVGYGTQKKASITGAISSVSSKDINAQPVVNVSQALQGRVAGVTVVNNGSPGEAPIIRIRGVGTINNAGPLFVVDGFPTSDLNSFNPKDIESVDVLKDASAAAIYGSRAANGVVLITTKRGAINKKLTVTFDSYYGVEQPWRKLDLLSTDQYIDYATDLMTNADIYKQETKAPADPDVVIGSSVPARISQGGLDQSIHSQTSQTFRQTNTNWQDEMFRTGRIQQHKVELSGGSASSKIFASAGFFEQEGIMLGTGYKRGDARFNSDHNVSKRVTIGQNFYVAFDERKIEQQSGGRTQLQHIIRSSPYFPVYNPDNYGGFFGSQGVDGSDPENPVRIASQDQQNQQRLKFLGNAYVDFKILDFLSYRFQGGLDYVDYTQRTHQPAFTTGTGGYSSRPAALLNQNRQNFASVLLTNQLTFNKMFGKHSINATLVAEQQTNNFTQVTGAGENPLSNDVQEPVAISKISFNGNRSQSALISYIVRANYEFDNKYLLGASFRRDGSSRFSPSNRWGNFPAISLGWRVSEESFLADNSVISDLKLRASYGVTGNNQSGDYAWISTISGNQIYQVDRTGGTGSTGYTIRALANPDLTWESTYMTNVGLDMGLLNNQLTISAEYFNNKTTDMIIQRPIPLSYGYDTAPFDNVGEVENKGFELELGYEKSEGALTFNVSGNVSVVRNRVLSLGDEGTTIAQGDWYGDNLTNTKVGQPIGYFNGYVVDGIFQVGESSPLQPNSRPGDIRFKDLNGDGALNSDDKTNIGHFLPDFSYGLSFTANWKGFDAMLFLQGVSGNEIYSVVKYDLEGMTRLFNSGTAVLNRWTPENSNTSVPRAVSGDPNQNARASDRFVENGSYFRIKNLTVGYNVSASSLSALTRNAVTKFRIYATTQNLLTVTKYKSGYDPEIGNRNSMTNGLTQGIDYGQFPQSRSLVVGVQIGF